jgi:hypothetical protein
MPSFGMTDDNAVPNQTMSSIEPIKLSFNNYQSM